MPIAIESEHVELAKSVKSLLAKVAPAEVLHAALEAPVQQSRRSTGEVPSNRGSRAWSLPESADGQGAGFLELAVVIAEFGYAAAPGPFVLGNRRCTHRRARARGRGASPASFAVSPSPPTR